MSEQAWRVDLIFGGGFCNVNICTVPSGVGGVEQILLGSTQDWSDFV